jgi:hypothetical protein
MKPAGSLDSLKLSCITSQLLWSYVRSKFVSLQLPSIPKLRSLSDSYEKQVTDRDEGIFLSL